MTKIRLESSGGNVHVSLENPRSFMASKFEGNSALLVQFFLPPGDALQLAIELCRMGFMPTPNTITEDVAEDVRAIRATVERMVADA